MVPIHDHPGDKPEKRYIGASGRRREVPGIVATARALATESGIPLLARFATFRTVAGPLLLAPFTRREVAGALTRQNLGHRPVASGVVRFELRNRVVMSWCATAAL
jgi:hypothetical protein